jgi:phosphonopyruvate decarboxylase
LREAGVEFFTGVPDLCFKPWVDYLNQTRKEDHIISTSEGEALCIAAGYNLSTGKVAGVYLQNSGLGNLINPLTSVVDKHVYKIPILLMISWRGRPGRPDEPQHKRMGESMTPLLEMMDIPYHVYEKGDDLSTFTETKEALSAGCPFAIVFEKGDIEPYGERLEAHQEEAGLELMRWDVIVSVAQLFERDVVFFSTTGETSRELYVWRDLTGGDHSLDFLNVGGMGWVSSLAFGFSLRSHKRVVVLDGDGSILMHMGNMATIGHYKPPNLIHIILDNRSHDSVGGLSTVSDTVDFAKVAAAVGYENSTTVSTPAALRDALIKARENAKPSLISVRIRKGTRPNLPRPALSPLERKQLMFRNLAIPQNEATNRADPTRLLHHGLGE